jgi:hypothetical protein
MCATKTLPTRVRWGRLYAVVLGTCAATTTLAIAAPTAPWRVAATLFVFIVAGIGMMQCLATQRVALDLTDWCACATSTVTVRLVHGHEPALTERASEGKRTAETGTTLRTCARVSA